MYQKETHFSVTYWHNGFIKSLCFSHDPFLFLFPFLLLSISFAFSSSLSIFSCYDHLSFKSTCLFLHLPFILLNLFNFSLDFVVIVYIFLRDIENKFYQKKKNFFFLFSKGWENLFFLFYIFQINQ